MDFVLYTSILESKAWDYIAKRLMGKEADVNTLDCLNADHIEYSIEKNLEEAGYDIDKFEAGEYAAFQKKVENELFSKKILDVSFGDSDFSGSEYWRDVNIEFDYDIEQALSECIKDPDNKVFDHLKEDKEEER